MTNTSVYFRPDSRLLKGRGGVKCGQFPYFFFEGFPIALPWSWYEYCAEITDSHGEQDTVCGGLHAGSAKDDDDDGVGDEGDHGKDGHHDTQQWEHIVHWSVWLGRVKCVASSSLKTSEVMKKWVIDEDFVLNFGTHLRISSELFSTEKFAAMIVFTEMFESIIPNSVSEKVKLKIDPNVRNEWKVYVSKFADLSEILLIQI